MSMLTPPGMGGKYRITGDKYPRMRRNTGRRRVVLAAIGGVVALGLVGWGTFQLIDVFTGGDQATAASAKSCRSKPEKPSTPVKALPAPAKIKVNVLNATPRGGLAKKTADELKKRGFKIGEVGNATKEYDKKVKGTGLLLGPATATDGAFSVLGTQLAGAGTKTDTRKTAEVDLIIGTKFKKLTADAQAAKALTALNKPKPVPAADKKC